MAEIIKIKDRLELNGKSTRQVTGAAQILLFTGIRYERFEPAPIRPEGLLQALPRPGEGIDQLAY